MYGVIVPAFRVAVVMVVFPSSLTEEEEALQKKYAKLKKKVSRSECKRSHSPKYKM